MKLQTYIDTQRGNATKLASSLGIGLSYLSQMATGERPIQPIRAVLIENLTKGAVTRKDLFPNDWQAIWPELVKKHKKETVKA